VNILIVDDHPLFLSGLRAVLHELPALRTIHEANTIEHALQTLQQVSDLDWICLDLQLPDGDGFTLLRYLREHAIEIPVAVLSANSQPAIVDRVLSAGASAYVSKSASARELRDAFAALARGERFVSPAIAAALDDYRAGLVSLDGVRVKLTRRQREILALLVSGHTNQGIADRLHLAESTVKAHVSTLFDLLKVSNRAACVRQATRYGLVESLGHSA